MDWAQQHTTDDIDHVVCEWPQVYRQGRSRGDPADLLPMAGIALGVSVGLATGPTAPTPAEWTGQLKKSTTGDPLASPRRAHPWSRLSEDERACVVLSHDALDAVGIGLWALGRLDPIRVYPGAT